MVSETGFKNKSPLSNDLKVACAIYTCKLEGEVVWYNKLVDLLKGKVSPTTISKSLHNLFDWGIVKAEYGETDKGRAGRLLFITNESEPTIKDLCEKYWSINQE
ncbi:MAG: hypothetical protein PHI15_05745 [Methanomicrobium sp.]|nr:hypothetical protein [Methanomicrobium sp.]